MRTALVYDRINKFGGAERVLLAIHEIFPEAPLYTSVYDKALTPWADVFEVRTSFLQKLPLPKSAHEMYPYLMGMAFENFDFNEFDLVISVTHEFAKTVITKPKTFHLCYCLNPVGYLWDSYRDYFSAKPDWFKSLSFPLIRYLRWYDKIVAQRPDRYLTISRTVQERVKRIYGRDSAVVYPPVEVRESSSSRSDEGFFLIVSRLVSNKRLDIAVDAFNKLGWPLKIIGTGNLKKTLRQRAGRNVEFLGYLTDSELSRYYETCRAVVITGEEDFNIVAVEAQAHGKPVVAFGRGGVTETVIPKVTGFFFPEATAESLSETLKETDFDIIKARNCVDNAEKFSKERFKKEFRSRLEREYSEYVRSL